MGGFVFEGCCVRGLRVVGIMGRYNIVSVGDFRFSVGWKWVWVGWFCVEGWVVDDFVWLVLGVM